MTTDIAPWNCLLMSSFPSGFSWWMPRTGRRHQVLYSKRRNRPLEALPRGAQRIERVTPRATASVPHQHHWRLPSSPMPCAGTGGAGSSHRDHCQSDARSSHCTISHRLSSCRCVTIPARFGRHLPRPQTRKCPSLVIGRAGWSSRQTYRLRDCEFCNFYWSDFVCRVMR